MQTNALVGKPWRKRCGLRRCFIRRETDIRLGAGAGEPDLNGQGPQAQQRVIGRRHILARFDPALTRFEAQQQRTQPWLWTTA